MNKIKGNFFEEHIEKIVLIVFGVLCMASLVSRVLLSPNSIGYDNHKFSPAKIDNYISGNAQVLDSKLNSQVSPQKPYSPRLGEFVGLMDTSVNIDVSHDFDLPIMNDRKISDDRKYGLPSIGSITGAAAEYIRAVAYVPTVKITMDMPYSAGNTEPNDIDFVTVQAEVDMNRLYGSFSEAFAGDDIPAAWRDPCFAKPVFAAVELQRQELATDGTWSEWQMVGRTKIDGFKEMLEIIEDVKGLPDGGMKVRMLQFDNRNIQMALLQPQAYEIASADERWLPPVLHQEYVKIQKDEKKRVDRATQEAEALEKAKQKEEKRKLQQERQSQNAAAAPTPAKEAPAEIDPAISERRQKALEARALAKNKNNPVPAEAPIEQTTSSPLDVFTEKVNKVMITAETNFKQMAVPVLFWAHDDTVEPGKSYQYRIRLGVFNPLAGTDMIKGGDVSQKNQVILWSDFAYSPQTISIPERSYFFAHEMMEAAGSVKVEVCKYILGYWYSKEFTVKPGETIGASVERSGLSAEPGVSVPTIINYDTGLVLVDLAAVNGWSSGKQMQPVRYYQMIYSNGGTELKYQPIKKTYWSDAVNNNFKMIRELQKEVPKPLRGWSGTDGQNPQAEPMQQIVPPGAGIGAQPGA